MGSYEIQWKGSAERDLRNIDPQQIPRIIQAIECLVDNPFPSHAVNFEAQNEITEFELGTIVWSTKWIPK